MAFAALAVLLLVSCVDSVAPLRRADPANSSLGHIYSIARNASTNIFQFLDVDLTTWESSVGPLPGGFGDVAAAAFSDGLYWTEQALSTSTRLLSAINVDNKAVVASINMSAWAPAPRFVVAIFPAPSVGGLLVVARSAPNAGQDVFLVSDPTGTANVTLAGTVDCPDCGDWAWDGVSDTLYAISNEESSDPSGSSLVGFSLSNASAPVLVANFTLTNAFEFPQWDTLTASLFGLSLVTGGPNGYGRNFTVLNDPSNGALNETSHGTIGDGLYVILEGGPKAFDPISRR